jgi:deazaflavin-dependent oxidoreductase (nitroreductase family)
MPDDDFVNAFRQRREISITVTGRTTGREITIPVWFVADEHGIWLLPVYGSDTQWYRNVEKNGVITIRAGANSQHLRARLLKDPQAVNKVVERFREKYSPEEIKRWYKGLDVAVQIPLAPATSES